MVKARTRVFKRGLKMAKFLGAPINAANLEKRRKTLDHLERFFRPNKAIKIEEVKRKNFSGEWIIAKPARKEKVVLYMHGGGFVFYPKLYRDMISRIGEASQGRVFSLNYSLAPEHPFPKALHEAVATYKWLLKTYKPADIVLAGDSAGGTLVLSLLQIIQTEKLPNPCCAVVMSPATDATFTGASFARNKKQDFFIKQDSLEFFVNAYFGTTAHDDPLASPLHGSMKGFPPLLMHVDKGEVMYDDTLQFAKKARQQGVDVTLYETDDLWHVFHLYARYVPEAKSAIKHIGDFIQAHL